MGTISMGRCEKHLMPIYKLADGSIFNSCGHCAPPAKDPSNKRLTGYSYHEEFCSDETLEALKGVKTRLSFNVPPWAEDEFFSDYLDCTGVQATFDTPGVHRNNARSMDDKRWYSAAFEFEETEGLVFSSKYDGRIKASSKHDGYLVIYCTHLAGFLLANGFRSGLNEPSEG